jgi:hypothetical protein
MLLMARLAWTLLINPGIQSSKTVGMDFQSVVLIPPMRPNTSHVWIVSSPSTVHNPAVVLQY